MGTGYFHYKMQANGQEYKSSMFNPVKNVFIFNGLAEDHYKMLNTKYQTTDPCSFRGKEEKKIV